MSLRIVSITTIAQQDIRDIAAYIAGDSPKSAKRFEEEFAGAIDRIREFPEIGHRRQELPANLYAARVSPRFRRYLILYRLLDHGARVQVVRVLHGSREISKALTDR
jgi:plasmid stabilization system protein ParE